MPIVEILRAIVFLNRTVDNKDFNEVVYCIPDIRMKVLEEGLKNRKDSGEINTVQIARHRTQATAFTEYFDDVDTFFEKIDSEKLPEVINFTGFDDVEIIS